MLSLMKVFDESTGRTVPVPGRKASEPLPQSGGSAAEADLAARRAEQWTDLYGDYLYRYALLRLRNRQGAEDVVQETFVAALQSYRNFQGRSSEKTWLVNILKHKIIDQFRKTGREDAVCDEKFEGWFSDVFNERGHWNFSSGKAPRIWSAPDPERAYGNQQFWKALHSSLEELPDRVADAFVLREIEGLETEEICRTLGVTRNNLWVMLHRARAYLRRSLEEGGFAVATATPKVQC